jgi:hypothetical protein
MLFSCFDHARTGLGGRIFSNDETEVTQGELFLSLFKAGLISFIA